VEENRGHVRPEERAAGRKLDIVEGRARAANGRVAGTLEPRRVAVSPAVPSSRVATAEVRTLVPAVQRSSTLRPLTSLISRV